MSRFGKKARQQTPPSPQSGRHLIKTLKRNLKDSRMAIIFLGLIIIPSGLLAYFSWRALENEKMLSEARLRESYRQFASLAGRDLDDEFEEVEEIWVSAVDDILEEDRLEPPIHKLEQLTAEEPLIEASFFLPAPGQVTYPSDVTLAKTSFFEEEVKNGDYLREHEIFDELAGRGEELEYYAFDLDSAIAVYRQILSRVSNPQLRAMTESYIGRALTKKGEWDKALGTFERLLSEFPEVRDLNKMYLRFLAQYQIAACLENLDRDEEAMERLLRLNRDLLDRSDVINNMQYTFFSDQIQALSRRLLSSPKLEDGERYKKQFAELAERSKKRFSQKYFLQVLDRQLTQMVIERKHYKAKFRYISDEAEDQPYLLAYRDIPDAQGIYVTGVLGLQVDLDELSGQLFPRMLKELKSSDQVSLAIFNDKGQDVFGSVPQGATPIAQQRLASPFDFWHVAVYFKDEPKSNLWSFRTVLGVWLIAILLISILGGAYWFWRRARYEARLSQLKSGFVSSVSHELRTPLASISMFAELLEMQLAGESSLPLEEFRASAGGSLGVIRRECERLKRLIENVLGFSSIERGVKQYNFEYEDPAAIVQKAVESFRPYAESHGFSVKTELSTDLPELLIDADAMYQAILNLLTNALKYSGDSREIEVRALESDHVALIEIVDHGLGIPKDEITKIFDEFYRGGQRLNSQEQGGMGLGLTLVRHIVSAHNGQIDVQSEVGRGSTFRISLPVTMAEDAKPVTPKEQQQVGVS